MKIRLSKSRKLREGGFAGVSAVTVAGVATAAAGAYAASKQSGSGASAPSGSGSAPGASAGGGGGGDGGTIFNGGSIFGTVRNTGSTKGGAGGAGGTATYSANDPASASTGGPLGGLSMTNLLIITLIGLGVAVFGLFRKK